MIIEVKKTVEMELKEFWLVRVIECGATSKRCIHEKIFNYEPNKQEIADVLADFISQPVFASVVRNYELAPLCKKLENPYQE